MPATGAPSTYAAPVDALEEASFAVFGAFDEVSLDRGPMRVRVAIAPGLGSLSNHDVVHWIATAVDGIAAYYGRPFTDRALVIVMPGVPGNPTRGVTLGDAGPGVLVRASVGLTPAETRDDWIVTHELLHVSLPSLPRENNWLSEGIATYVEPIVRARAGLISPQRFWGDLVRGLPQGEPEAGDEGLENTHTWGRTYCGGALYCLAADVAIRERAHNARSFDDALRGIVAMGADVEAHWSIAQFIAAGDRAVDGGLCRDGGCTLAALYRSLALRPGKVDLESLWQRLGVRLEAGDVVFDDRAPLAAIRSAITAPDPSTTLKSAISAAHR
jgi:hypothetical protein